jgi:hypothetical protein
MAGASARADALCGMHVITPPEPERGRAHARLQAAIDAVGRFDPDRPSAVERLDDELGPALARTLVFALTGGVRRGCEVEAA